MTNIPQSRSTAIEKLHPGTVFNPWRYACGFYPPELVNRIPQKDLADGPKRVYTALTRYAGRDGRCWPSQRRLADDLGKSERQIRRDIATLEGRSLIRRRVTSRGRSRSTRTEYEFIFHPIFQEAYTSAAVTTGHREDYDRTPESITTGQECPPNTAQRESNAEGERAESFATPEEQSARPPAESPSILAEGKEPDAPEVEAVSDLLDFHGVSYLPGDPARLLELAAGGGCPLLCRFLAELLQKRRERGQAVESAALLLKIVPEQFPQWIRRNPRTVAALRPRGMETELPAPYSEPVNGSAPEPLPDAEQPHTQAAVRSGVAEKTEPASDVPSAVSTPRRSRPSVACYRCGDWGRTEQDGRFKRCGCAAGANVPDRLLNFLNQPPARSKEPVPAVSVRPGRITAADIAAVLRGAGSGGAAAAAV